MRASVGGAPPLAKTALARARLETSHLGSGAAQHINGDDLQQHKGKGVAVGRSRWPPTLPPPPLPPPLVKRSSAPALSALRTASISSLPLPTGTRTRLGAAIATIARRWAVKLRAERR